MKILDRYLIRGFLFTFFLSIAGVSLLVIFVDLVGNLGKFIDKSVAGKIIVQYYLAYIPFIISQALPMAMLFGGMFSLSQKARNNELIVMKSTGISVMRIISPLMLVSLILSIGAFELNETIVPEASQRKSDIEMEYIGSAPSMNGKRVNNVFWTTANNRTIFIGRFDSRTNLANRVTIQEHIANQILQRVDAQTMRWQEEGWLLENGFKRTFFKGTENAVPFQELRDPTLTFGPEQILKKQVKPENMSLIQLQQYIDSIYGNGGDPTKWRVDLAFKFSTPFAGLILVLFGASISSRRNRGSIILGAIISIVIYLLYFGMSSFVKTLGQLSILPPLVAAWLTNGVFFIGGLFVLFVMRK